MAELGDAVEKCGGVMTPDSNSTERNRKEKEPASSLEDRDTIIVSRAWNIRGGH